MIYINIVKIRKKEYGINEKNSIIKSAGLNETKPIVLIFGGSQGAQKINDAIFYRDVNYVIYIPKDFGKNLLDGKNPSLEYKSCGDEYSSYAQMMVEKYIKTVLIYKDYYSGVELISKVNKVVDKDTKVYMKTTLDISKLSSMTQYFNILNYALLAGCVYCISMILASLNDETVRKRTIISSFNYKK